MTQSKRSGETRNLADFLPAERRRILSQASETRRAQMRAAEASRDVYRAWNEICAGTREGAHVTGLHYVPESNELIVYADGSSWVAELTMMREIIRARMYRCGVDIANIKVLLTRPGYTPHRIKSARAAASPSAAAAQAAPACPLTPSEESALEGDLSPIEDPRLRDALKKAMKASLEHKNINKDQT